MMGNAIAAGMVASEIDPYDPANATDPHPRYAALRDLGPVVWLTAHQCAFVGRYEEVNEVQLRPHDFVSSRGVGLSDINKSGNWRPPSPIVEVDPPQHTEIRTAMQRILSPRRLAEWRGRFSETASRICDEALARGQEDGHGGVVIDAATELAERYVFEVFSESLGVDLDLRSTVTLGNFIFNAGGPQNELFHRSRAEAEALGPWFETRQQREAMKPGGVGEAIYAAEDAGELPAGTAPLMVRTLIRGGMDTTISGLASTLRLLAEHPDAWARVREEPAFGMVAFEEAIRLESPAQIHYRTTNAEVELSGVRIPADTKLAVSVGSANRDPRHWEEPDTFKPGARTGKHLAFGMGPHLCIGRQIAKLEIECFLPEFLKRVSAITLASRYRYRQINGLRTLQSLPLRLERTRP